MLVNLFTISKLGLIENLGAVVSDYVTPRLRPVYAMLLVLILQTVLLILNLIIILTLASICISSRSFL